MNPTKEAESEGYYYIVGLHGPMNLPEEAHARMGFY